MSDKIFEVGVKLGHSSTLKKTNKRTDFADTLSYRMTTRLLLLANLILMLKLYLMQPISCYVATSVGGKDRDIIKYIEDYCLLEGSIPLSPSSTLPTSPNEWLKHESKRTSAYQHIQIILAVQTVFFYIPHLIWKMLCHHASYYGCDILRLCDEAHNGVFMDEEQRKNFVVRLSKILADIIQPKTDRKCKGSKFKQMLLSCLQKMKRYDIRYMVVKLLYLVNVIINLVLMKYYYGITHTTYRFIGIELLQDVLKGKTWEKTLLFPRVAYCLVKLRHVGATNTALAQCALPINMLNEMFCIFFWFWFSFVCIATILSIIKVLLPIICLRSEFALKYLKLHKTYTTTNFQKLKEKIKLKSFEEKLHSTDGIFLLQTIESSAGEYMTGEIVKQLWDIYNPDSDINMLDESRLERKMTILPNKPTAPTFLPNNNDKN